MNVTQPSFIHFIFFQVLGIRLHSQTFMVETGGGVERNTEGRGPVVQSPIKLILD